MAAVTFYGNNAESATIGYEGGSEIVSGGVQGDFIIRNNLNKNIILTGGNVGIGTTSPGRNLTVATSGEAYVSVTGGASSDVGVLFGTSASDAKGRLIYNNADNMQFWTASTERMRITSGGSLLIGKIARAFGTAGIDFQSNGADCHWTATSSSLVAFNRLSTDGTLIEFAQDGTVEGTISISGNTTSYNTSSDYRLKQDLKDFNGLSLVNQINVYDYQWKSDSTRSYGVMAHELQSVLPYAVTGVKDGEKMQGVDYSKIVPVLIKAIQELKAEIDILKNK
jgi:hypothetical protein